MLHGAVGAAGFIFDVCEFCEVFFFCLHGGVRGVVGEVEEPRLIGFGVAGDVVVGFECEPIC